MATQLEVQYVINATLGQLGAISELHNQLKMLQDLAREGAEFGVRIDPTGLNGIRESVARAVAAGVKAGGVQVDRQASRTAGSAPAGGSAAGEGVGGSEIDMLARQMKRLRSTMKKMAGDGSSGAAAVQETMLTLEQIDEQLEQRKRAVRAWRKRLDGARKLNRSSAGDAQNTSDAFTDLWERAVGGVDTLGKTQRTSERATLNKIRENYANATSKGNAPQVVAALTALRAKVDELSKRTGGQEEWITKQLGSAEKDLDIAMSNRRTTEVRRAGGVTGSGAGVAINSAQLTAAFERAADAFAQRVQAALANLPINLAGGATTLANGGGFSAGVGAIHSTPVAGPSGASSLAYKMCRKCNGSGNWNGKVCFRCGGSGDENHPNMGAAMAAGAKAEWVGNRVSNPITGAEANPIIPHSEGRRADLLEYLGKLDKRRREGALDMTGKRQPLSERDRLSVESQMHPLIEELEQGGVPRLQYEKHPHVVNGVFSSAMELKRMESEPMFTPTAAHGKLKWDGSDPLQKASQHVNELSGAIDGLNKVNVAPLMQSFQTLSGVLHQVAQDMREIKTGMGNVVPAGAELQYTKLLNAEKERHANSMKRTTEEERARRDMDRISTTAQRMRRAEELNTGEAVALPDGIFNPDRMSKRLGTSLRRLGRMDERLDDLRMASAASGGSTFYDSQRIRLGEQRMGLRSSILRQSLRLEEAKPGSSGLNIDALRTAIDGENRYVSAATALAGYDNASALHKAYTSKPGQKSLKDMEALQDASDSRAQFLKKLQDMGIAEKGRDPSNQSMDKMLVHLADMRKGVEQTSQSLLKQVAVHAEMREGADEGRKAFDLFGRKLRDVTAYMIAAGIIFGTLNGAKQAIVDAMKFESDMAEVQGIFIAKTQLQRDAVKTGVMQSAVDYGVDRSRTAQVAKMFAQTGASPEKTIELTNAALLANRGAGLNIDQASEMLIAVDNITNGRVKSGDVIDRISRVEARHAVTAPDLSAILQKAAPFAAMLQPQMLGSVDSLDTLMGMGTTLIEKTRMSGAAAGTTIKFLMARLAAPQVQRKLQDQFGINLGGDNPDQMRAMSDIFGDIASKYKGYQASGESGKAAALLTTFAGARQANAAGAIFDDWKASMDTAKESSLAFGDSQRRLAIQMDTLEAKTSAMGSAFQNFTTKLIEDSGLLSLLKMGASGGAGLFGFMSQHPGTSMVVGGSGIAAAGSVLRSAALASQASGAAGGFFGGTGMLGASMPTVGALATSAGLAAAGLGAFAIARSTFMRREWDAMAEDDKYGTAKYDASTYAGSDQGKDYRLVAGKFGLSEGTLYSKIALAAKFAEDEATKQFGAGYFGEHAKTDPKLGRFLEEKFVESLRDSVPAFKDIKDNAEATAVALDMLRKSALYGGVSHFVQQGDFAEKAHALGQEWMQNLQAPQDAETREMLRRVRQFHYEVEFGNENKYDNGKHNNLAIVTPQAVGMSYNYDLATRMGHLTGDSRMSDMRRILNAEQSRLGVGDALGNLRMSNGQMFLQKVDTYLRGTTSLGEALDAAAESVQKLSEADRTHLSTIKDLTSEQKAQLERGTNYNRLVAQMQQSVGIALDTSGRQQQADATAPGAQPKGSPSGGMKAADLIMQAMEEAVNNKLQSIKPNSDEFKRLVEFRDAHFSPENRQQTRLNIIGNMAGANIRAYLRDRVFDEVLRYGERSEEIKQSTQYMRGTGIGFNPLQERAAASTQFLQGLIKVSSQLPMDELRTAHRLSMAAAKGVDPNSIMGVEEGDLNADEGVRFTNEWMTRLKGLKKSGLYNDKQVEQLGIQLTSSKAAIQAWANGRPDSIIDALGDKYKAQFAQILGAKTPAELGATALKMGPWFLQLAQQMAGRDVSTFTQQSVNSSNLQSRLTIEAARLQHGFALKQQGLQSDLGLAQVDNDHYAIGDLQRQALQAQHETALGMASSTYSRTMATLNNEADKSPGLRGEHGELLGDIAVKAADAANAWRQAVVDANLEAQRNMIALINETHLDYYKAQDAHVKSLAKEFADPFASMLGNTKELLTSRKFGTLAESLGSSLNQRLASTFVNNLVGENGIFAEQFEKLFNNPLMDEADLIKKAHVDGIMQGFKNVYDAAAGVTPGALPALGMGPDGAGGVMAMAMGLGGTGLGGFAYMASTQQRATDARTQKDITDLSSAGELANVADASQHLDFKFSDGTRLSPKQTALLQAATLAATYTSSAVFGRNGVRSSTGMPLNYAVEGSQVGSSIGMMAAPFMGPLAPVAPIIGSLLGGFVGSRFGKPDEPPPIPQFDALAKIERNTRETAESIQNQTRTLLSPENRLLYAPSTFQMPGYKPFDAGQSNTSSVNGPNTLPPIVINVNGAQDPQTIAEQVAAHLKTQLGDFGTYTDSRY